MKTGTIQNRILAAAILTLVCIATLIVHTIDYDSRYGVQVNRNLNSERTLQAVDRYRGMVERGEVGQFETTTRNQETVEL